MHETRKTRENLRSQRWISRGLKINEINKGKIYVIRIQEFIFPKRRNSHTSHPPN